MPISAKIFFIIALLLELVGIIMTIVGYIQIQSDMFTSFPAWSAFVFYLLPFSICAIVFMGIGFLFMFIKRKNS